MPEVSVVIPSNRGGEFLRDAIASVQAQTLDAWELIIVLDGCEEDLSDLERSDERLRVFRQRNRGISISRNVGVRHARAELVAFLDDDDRMLTERLLAQVAAMKDEAIGVCHTQFEFIDENGTIIESVWEANDAQYQDFLRGDGGILISSTMVRKSLLLDVGGFHSLYALGEDLELLYRLARESKVAFLPEVLTQYRRHDSNKSFTMGGGKEYRLNLRQHLLIARGRGERANVKAVRRGISLVPSGWGERAVRRAHDARTRRNFVEMACALVVAFVFSPRVAWRVSARQASRDLRWRASLSVSDDIDARHEGSTTR